MPSAKAIGVAIVVTGLAIAALIPVFLVLYPAAGLGRNAAQDAAALLPVLARTPALFVGPGLVELVGHAIGAVAILGIWFRWGRESFGLTCATLAGIAWMAVDTLDNAVSIQVIPQLATAFAAGDSSATTTFDIVVRLTDALRLAGHFGGGLWVIGAAWFARRAQFVPGFVGWLGVPVGVVLALNPVIPALLNVSFMTLPLWLILFGATMARSTTTDTSAMRRAMADPLAARS